MPFWVDTKAWSSHFRTFENKLVIGQVLSAIVELCRARYIQIWRHWWAVTRYRPFRKSVAVILIFNNLTAFFHAVFNPKWGSEKYMQQCMAYLLFQSLDS